MAESKLIALNPGKSDLKNCTPIALASKKRRVVKVDFVNDCVWMFESAGGLKQNLARQCMAKVQAVKVLLATCPRALLRSTLTARSSAKMRR